MNTAIIYTTKHGAAEKAAESLKQQLPGSVELINLRKDSNPLLDPFETVILGGSIYMGQPQKELSRFIKGNLKLLLTKRVGLYLCAGQTDLKMLEQEMNSAFPAELQERALVKEVFGYEYDFSKLNFLEKLVVRKVVGKNQSEFALSAGKIQSFAEEMGK